MEVMSCCKSIIEGVGMMMMMPSIAVYKVCMEMSSCSQAVMGVVMFSMNMAVLMVFMVMHCCIMAVKEMGMMMCSRAVAVWCRKSSCWYSYILAVKGLIMYSKAMAEQEVQLDSDGGGDGYCEITFVY